MKDTFAIIVMILFVSCNNQEQTFEPIEDSSKLSENQIDSILTKFNFKYEEPILIDSTEQVVIPISTELLEKRSKFSSGGYYSNDFPRYWNALFYNKSTGETRLLTKDKTRISRIHANRKEEESKTMKTKILYELTQIDYNQDGRLNGDDPEFLYVSNVDGKQLSQISPMNEDLQYFDVLPNTNQIILRTLRDTNQDSIFNREDESILYKIELKQNKWIVNEIVDLTNRKEIENLYFKQWLTKNK